jgi:hypothetical protein
MVDSVIRRRKFSMVLSILLLLSVLQLCEVLLFWSKAVPYQRYLARMQLNAPIEVL